MGEEVHVISTHLLFATVTILYARQHFRDGACCHFVVEPICLDLNRTREKHILKFPHGKRFVSGEVKPMQEEQFVIGTHNLSNVSDSNSSQIQMLGGKDWNILSITTLL